MTKTNAPAGSFACFLATDERTAPYAGAIAYRIATEWGLDAHVFVDRKDKTRDDVPRVKHPRVTYHFDKLLDLVEKTVPDRPGLSKAAWGRLFAPAHLQHYDRLLYLDTDILPGPKPPGLEDITFDTPLAMVGNYWSRYLLRTGHATTQAKFTAYGFAPEDHFNSGVMLLKTAQWDHIAIADGFVAYLDRHRANLWGSDQQFLCWHFKDRITELSVNLNFLEMMMHMGLEGGATPALTHYIHHPKVFERLPRFGVANTTKVGVPAFRKMVSDAGLGWPKIAPQRPPRLDRRGKHVIRGALNAVGLAQDRARDARAKWLEMRAIMVDLIEDARPRCADTLPFTPTATPPDVVWKGFKMVLK